MSAKNDKLPLSVREKVPYLSLELRVLESINGCSFNLHIETLGEKGFALDDPFYISSKEPDDEFKKTVKKLIIHGISKYVDAVFDA